jgi:NADH-quinone oxidoreductase subunit M
MMQKVFYGKTVAATENASESSASSRWMLGLIIMIVLVTGIFPQPVLNLANDTVKMVIARFHLF